MNKKEETSSTRIETIEKKLGIIWDRLFSHEDSLKDLELDISDLRDHLPLSVFAHKMTELKNKVYKDISNEISSIFDRYRDPFVKYCDKIIEEKMEKMERK